MEKLNLTKINAYGVDSSDDEYRSSIKGYYENSNIASVKAKGSGWYGSDGKVVPVELWKDETTGLLYEVKMAGNGKFTDVAEKYKEDTLASIKSKLTDDELILLGLKK